MTIVKNRSEILFLYDITDANPNGDPVDENKPRVDEETGVNIVTDVRLKRTIRDYLYDYKNQDVFILELRDGNGNLKSKEDRLKDFKDNEDLLKKCIDVRLFGATTAVKGKTMTLTGPVQFKYGRSLHRVDMTYVKGTDDNESASAVVKQTLILTAIMGILVSVPGYIFADKVIGFMGAKPCVLRSSGKKPIPN